MEEIAVAGLKGILNGKVCLTREKSSYKSVFSIIKEDLVNLLAYTVFLHPQEQAYFDTLSYDKRKISYLLGRIAAKNAVAELTGLQEFRSLFIDFGVFQFPVLKSPVVNQSIQVSISHCDHIGIALAFDEAHPMAVDIEKVCARQIESIKSNISTQEFSLISASGLSLEIGCTMIWTIKESLSKIFRTGLCIDFKILEIASLKHSEAVYTSTFSNFIQYKALSFFAGDYVCTVVLPRNTTADLTDFINCFNNIAGKNGS